MRELGIDIPTHRSKPAEEFCNQKFDFVETSKWKFSGMSATIWLPASDRSYRRTDPCA
jgi:protein-tyrosine-phosphatase